jgi:hypothetical protein
LRKETKIEKRIPHETCGIEHTYKKLTLPLKKTEEARSTKFEKGEVESRLKDQICTTGF